MSKCLAIVPSYNEAGAIVATILEIRTHAPDFDVVVVDDGSTDATARLARSVGATVISHPFNLGIGGAMQSGYQYALEQGYDIAVQVDGDGQHDARCIPELLAELRADPNLNMVTGSRFLSADRTGYRSSASRRLGIRVFARLLSLLTWSRVTDPACGYRAVRADALRRLDFRQDQFHNSEFIVEASKRGLTTLEVPVTVSRRLSGASKKPPHFRYGMGFANALVRAWLR
jgi:glycosyltransferase involved in cell wall biosynthesis